jgi:hypothetical protein
VAPAQLSPVVGRGGRRQITWMRPWRGVGRERRGRKGMGKGEDERGDGRGRRVHTIVVSTQMQI